MAQNMSSMPILLNAAAWQAPRWMTIKIGDNNSIINPIYYEAWANYQLR